MNDISKCNGVIKLKMCSLRDKCRRFIEVGNSERQSYVSPQQEPCEFFLLQNKVKNKE